MNYAWNDMRDQRRGREDAAREMAVPQDEKKAEEEKPPKILNDREPPNPVFGIPGVMPVFISPGTGGGRATLFILALAAILFLLGYLFLPIVFAILAFGCTYPAGILSSALRKHYLQCTIDGCMKNPRYEPTDVPFTMLGLQRVISDIGSDPVESSIFNWMFLYAAFLLDKHAAWVGVSRASVLGWVVRKGSYLQGPVLRDVRADYTQASKPADSRATLIVAMYIEALSGDYMHLVYSPAMMEQAATRLESSSPSDMSQMVQQHMSRITNQMFDGCAYNNVVTDSSIVAMCFNTHKRLRMAMLSRLAETTSVSLGGVVWLLSALSAAVVAISIVPVIPSLLPLFFQWGTELVPLLRSFVQGVFSIFTAPASVVPVSGILDVVVLTPLLEEALKTVLFFCGVPHPGVLFGVFEFIYFIRRGENPLLRFGPLILHAFSSSLPFHVRVLLHSAWNCGFYVHRHFTSCGGHYASVWRYFVSWTRRLPVVILPPARVPRLFGFGYRIDDGIAMPVARDYKGKIKELPGFLELCVRRPMQVGLGPTVAGLACPMVDRNHGPTVLRGCKQRFMACPPRANRDALKRLKAYVQRRVLRYVPIQADADVSPETWLQGTDYTLERKAELLRVWHDCLETLSPEHYDVLGHCKDETYMAYKDARGINSRTDAFKVYCGPYFKLMESEVYKDRAFIKHVPVRERPQYIFDMLGHFGGVYYETDYTTFEALFEPIVMESIEMVLYKHMLVNFPDVYAEIHDTLCGTNKCKYKHFIVKLKGKRMSGEMCTSLGNGFSNLMLAEFIAYEQGHALTGVVEGDDGLFSTRARFTAEAFTELGFNIKILEHTSLLRTSFCGLMMSDDLITMTDPAKVIANFGWTHSSLMWGGDKVRLGLLRAKALSLLYEHPQCPILSALAKRYIQLTEGYKPRFSTNWYDTHLAKEVVLFATETLRDAVKGPTMQSRLDFCDLYGVSIHQQLCAEAYLGTSGFAPLNHWSISSLYLDAKYEPLWHYGATYVSESLDAY